MKFPFSYQTENSDCGPTCLKMIAAYYGQHYELIFLKKKFKIKKAGVSMLDIKKAAKAIGFHCRGVKMEMKDLKKIVRQTPVILHWNKSHFVILYRYRIISPGKRVYSLADPAKGLVRVSETNLKKRWIENKINRTLGYALLIEPIYKKTRQLKTVRRIPK